jgi:hypothetical protein
MIDRAELSSDDDQAPKKLDKLKFWLIKSK